MTKQVLILASCLICALLFMPLTASAVTVLVGTSLLVRTLDQVSSSDPPGQAFAAVPGAHPS